MKRTDSNKMKWTLATAVIICILSSILVNAGAYYSNGVLTLTGNLTVNGTISATTIIGAGTGSGNVNSTGTVGYIPYTKATNVLGNSPFYTNGTHLAIGGTDLTDAAFRIDGTNGVMLWLRRDAASNYGGSIDIQKRGVAGNSSGPLATGADLGGLRWRTWDDTIVASVVPYSAQAHNASQKGVNLQFWVTPNGNTTQQEKMRLTDNGALAINSTTASSGILLQIRGASNLSGNVRAEGNLVVTGTSALTNVTMLNTTGSSWCVKINATNQLQPIVGAC